MDFDEKGGPGQDHVPVQKEEPKPIPKAKRQRKWISIALVAVVLLAGAAGGFAYYLYSSQFVSTDDAFIDAQIVQVAPQEAGALVAVPIQNNARVKTGEVLVKIDAAGPTASLALAQAQLQQAVAGAAQAEAQLGQAQAAFEGAKSKKTQADVTAAESAKLADRYQALTKRTDVGVISTQTLDDAVAASAENKAAADSALTEVNSARSGVMVARSALTSAQAQVKAMAANVAIAQVTVDRLTIVAPINGHVVQLNVNLGSYVQPGMQIMAIVPDEVYVTANYKETQLDQVRIGAKVDLTVDAYPDVKFNGTVQSIQRGAGQAFQLLPAQNATGNFVKVVQRVPVRISIDSQLADKYPIGPGMSVVPSIILDTGKHWYDGWF